MPRKLVVGVNDLQSAHPEIASQALDWDPTTVSYGSNKIMPWNGKCGHSWHATIKNRVLARSGCPYCAGQSVLPGFNDLMTIAPDVAQYAHGWDPRSVTAKSGLHKTWKCHCGYIWETSPNSMMFSRDIGTNGCHACSRRNFRFNDAAYLYLMNREGEQQIGITNNPSNRFRRHYLNGWNLTELIGPKDGRKIHNRELAIKRWIRSRIGCVAGTRENWYTSRFRVSSISELEWIISQDLAWQLTGR